MLKQNKGKLLITSLATLLPSLAGLILWDRLPQKIAVHFTPDGTPDTWAPKAVAVFALPLVMLGMHLICLLATAADPKGKNIGRKPLGFLFWLVPLISLVTNGTLLACALQAPIRIGSICILLLGIIEVLLGNYLPKVQQNFTFGLRWSWTLDDPENWTRTHRVAGWTMVAGGLLLLSTAYWPNITVLLAASLLPGLVSFGYSYLYYRRHRKSE